MVNIFEKKGQAIILAGITISNVFIEFGTKMFTSIKSSH